MRDSHNAFHLAVPVRDLDEAQEYYVAGLGCHLARRYDDRCRKFHDRKSAQVNGIVATKALACKLAKAAWHMMSQNTDYDAGRMFPGAKK